MKQRYRCAVVGSGASDDDDEFRPKVADCSGVSWEVREAFVPGAASVAVEVTAAAAVHAAIAEDPDIVAIP